MSKKTEPAFRFILVVRGLDTRIVGQAHRLGRIPSRFLDDLRLGDVVGRLRRDLAIALQRTGYGSVRL
jgi:hypothetical protein